LAHGQGAVQYNEWSQEGHANALEGLQRFVVPGNDAANAWLNECLDCHSEDYRMLKAAGTDVSKMTIEDFKYGVTCQTCHDSHVKGEQAAVWNEERHPQLTAPRQRLCVECHTAQIPAKANGRPGIATAGSEVHNPMKEMMDGTGAIDVPQGSPSVHKGRCVQCHMVPTGYDRTGVEATAGNHLFAIIEPEQAAETTMQLTFGGVPTTKAMPYSSCTTCHTQDGTKYGLYLQETLDDRQEAMKTWDGEVTVALEAAAKDLGFKGDAIANANSTLNDKKAAGGSWNASQLNFQKGFTNQTFVESEGSMGIHNWEYARTVILKALSQAHAVNPVPVVTIKTSASTVNVNASVTISGVVNTATTGKVTIQSKKGSGSWSTWKTASLTSYGKYSSGSVKMTSKGTYHFRAKFGATAAQIGGTSAQVKVVVK
jgi:formate-dependent nitrite reductase cytochrome c552 subunit